VETSAHGEYGRWEGEEEGERGDIEGIHEESEDEVVGEREGSFRLKYKDREMDGVKTENTNAKHQARPLSISIFQREPRKEWKAYNQVRRDAAQSVETTVLGLGETTVCSGGERVDKKGCFINTPASQEVSDDSSSARRHP